MGVDPCVQRSVPRDFLCGHDPLTGEDDKHRKGWIQKWLELLAGYYGIEVLAPILRRLGVGVETWVEMVVPFGRWFRRVAGRAERLAAEASRRGLPRMQGISQSRAASA